MERFKRFLKGEERSESDATNAGTLSSPDATTAAAGTALPRHQSMPEGEFDYGLHDPVHEEADPQVDIIAVHGLNGDRIKTWTIDNVFWLRDLLPATLREAGIRARIWSYGYNARSYSQRSQVSVQSLWDHGQAFLTEVVSRRAVLGTDRLPIIFIVHSLGGLVLKGALVLSDSSRPNHLARNKALKLSTHGVIFCGVPHQGANGVSEAKIIHNAGSPFIYTTTKIVNVLQPGNEVLSSQRDLFVPISGDFFTVNLWETEETPVKVGKILIVPKDSAVIPGSTGPKYCSPQPINGKNHVNLVRFSSPRDPAYGMLSNQLVLMLREGFRDINKNWEDWARVLRERMYHGSRLRPNLPQAPSPRFCGRQKDLEVLSNFMRRTETEIEQQNVVAIYGLGGVGKTEMVLQYVYMNGREYNSVLWINAKSKTTMQLSFMQAMQDLVHVEAQNAPGANADFSKIAFDLGIAGLINEKGLLDLPENDEGAVQRVVDGMKSWLAKDIHGTWLLIFDNHDAMDFPLRQCFPTCIWGSIIVTSRRPDIRSYATMGHYHDLQGLDEESAISLLLSVSGRDRQDPEVIEGARRVAEKLQYFPLAIDQAAALLSLYAHMSFNDYITRYDQQAKVLLSTNEHPWPDYSETCMTTWEISRSFVRKKSRPAAILLQVCSFLDNDDIWGDLLRRSFYFEGELVKGKNIDDHIALLYSFSLIKPKLGADTFSIHGVVHTWGRERLETQDRMFTTIGVARMLKDAITFVHGQTAPRTGEEGIFEKRLLPHLEHFLRFSQSIIGVEPLRLAVFARVQTGTQKQQADSIATQNQNLTFQYKVLELLDTTRQLSYLVDDNLPSNSICPSPLLAHRYFRDLDATNDRWRQTVLDVEETTTKSLIILGDAFTRQGRPQEGARVELSLIYLLLGMVKDDLTGALVHIGNLANQLRDLAEYQIAVNLMDFVIANWPTSQAETTEKLVELKSILAVTFSRMGRWVDANALFAEIGTHEQQDTVIDSDREAFVLNQQAVNLTRQEKYSAAEKLHRAVLQWREKSLPPNHPQILEALNGLAVTLEKQNKLDEAEALHRRTLEHRQNLFSRGHIAILRSTLNLGVTLKKQGRLADAELLYKEALADYEAFQGPDHDETIRTRMNLAVLYADQSNFAIACPMLAACAKALAVKMGIEHPQTLNAISSWAFCLINIGNLTGARNLFAYILHVRRRVLVNDHALRQAFEGLSSVRRRYVALGYAEKLQRLDDMVGKQERLLMERFVAQQRALPEGTRN